MHDDVDRPFFIQISNQRGIDYLARFKMPKDANVYSKRKDSTGANLIRIGREDHNGYQGHLVIVRCMSGELLTKAENIVRDTQGIKRRESSGHNNASPRARV